MLITKIYSLTSQFEVAVVDKKTVKENETQVRTT